MDLTPAFRVVSAVNFSALIRVGLLAVTLDQRSKSRERRQSD